MNSNEAVPALRIEPAVDHESLRRKTLSVRSHVCIAHAYPSSANSINTQNTHTSAEEHIMSYYFQNLLSPTYTSRDIVSLASREDSGEYDTTSILAAYERNRTPSPGSLRSSPVSVEHRLPSPYRLGRVTALRASPQTTEEEEQYRQDIAFMQRVLRIENTPDALTLQRKEAAAQTLDLLQQVMSSRLQLQNLVDTVRLGS
jgi:hypothetical protein